MAAVQPIDPTAPKFPEVDINLLQNLGGEVEIGAPYPGFDEVLIPNDQQNPEVDIALLPGVPGQRGPTGPRGATGAAGPTGPTGPTVTNQQILDVVIPAVAYKHNQTSASTTWTINHNLKFFPNVTAFDSGGTMVEGNVVHQSNLSLTIQFSAAISGNALLS
jgi:hypothetical protein